MTTILNTSVAAAVSGSLSRRMAVRGGAPRSLLAQFDFVYGSGGTSLKAWLQTTLDGGKSWIDIASFAVTTASAKKVVNLSSLTPVTSPYAPTDGSLADNTVKDG